MGTDIGTGTGGGSNDDGTLMAPMPTEYHIPLPASISLEALLPDFVAEVGDEDDDDDDEEDVGAKEAKPVARG